MTEKEELRTVSGPGEASKGHAPQDASPSMDKDPHSRSHRKA